MKPTFNRLKLQDRMSAMDYQLGVARALALIITELLNTGSEHERLLAIDRAEALKRWCESEFTTLDNAVQGYGRMFGQIDQDHQVLAASSEALAHAAAGAVVHEWRRAGQGTAGH